jgi:ketopantoate hydroxymethyltransferase
MAEEMEAAARQYIADVQEGRFPAAEHSPSRSIDDISEKAQ